MFGKVNVGGYWKRIFQLSDIEPVYETIQSNTASEKYVELFVENACKTISLFDENYCFVIELLSTAQIRITKFTIDLSLISVITTTELYENFGSKTNSADIKLATNSFLDYDTHFIFICDDKWYKLDKSTCSITNLSAISSQIIGKKIVGLTKDLEGNIVITSYLDVTPKAIHLFKVNKNDFSIISSITLTGVYGANTYPQCVSLATLAEDGKFYFSFSYQTMDEEGTYHSGYIYVVDYNLNSVTQFFSVGECIGGEIFIDVKNNCFYYGGGVDSTLSIVKRMLSNPSTIISKIAANFYGTNLSTVMSSHNGIINDTLIFSASFGYNQSQNRVSTATNVANHLNTSQNVNFLKYDTKNDIVSGGLNVNRTCYTYSNGTTSIEGMIFFPMNRNRVWNKNYICLSQCSMTNNTSVAVANRNKIELLVKPYSNFSAKVHNSNTISTIAQSDDYIVTRSGATVGKSNPRVYNAQTLDFIKELTARNTSLTIKDPSSYIYNGEVYQLWGTSNEIEIYNIETGTNRIIQLPSQTYYSFLVKDGFIYVIGLITSTNKCTLNKYDINGTFKYSVDLQSLYGITYTASTTARTNDIVVDNGSIYLIGTSSNLVILNNTTGALISIETLSTKLYGGYHVALIKLGNIILYTIKHLTHSNALPSLNSYDLVKKVNLPVYIDGINTGIYGGQTNLHSIDGVDGMFVMALSYAYAQYVVMKLEPIKYANGIYQTSVVEKLYGFDTYSGVLPTKYKNYVCLYNTTQLYKLNISSPARYNIFKGYRVKR